MPRQAQRPQARQPSKKSADGTGQSRRGDKSSSNIGPRHESSMRSVATHRAYDRVEDRKSTRLNSSHSQISYAVFCLKKKKITTTTAPQHTYKVNLKGAKGRPLLIPYTVSDDLFKTGEPYVTDVLLHEAWAAIDLSFS